MRQRSVVIVGGLRDLAVALEERVDELGEREVAPGCRRAVQLGLDDVAVVVQRLRLRRERAAGANLSVGRSSGAATCRTAACGRGV